MWEIWTVEFLLYLTLATSLLAPLTSPSGKRRLAPFGVALAGLGAFIAMSSVLLYATSLGKPVSFYDGLIVQDSFTSLMLLGIGIATITYLVAVTTEGLGWTSSPSLYSLVPLALFGSFFLAGANDLLVILASWLLVSIISYVAVALPDSKESKAAAVRYIFVGSVATLMLVLAIAFAAVASGTYSFSLTSLQSLQSYAKALAALAVLFLLAALGFKVGLFPFHWWLPSVYGRGDGRTISLVATVIKLSFIATLTRVFVVIAAGSSISGPLALTLAALAVATMTYGNVAAFTTRDLQVILAYSSMAQIGYIFAAMAAAAYFAGDLNMHMLRIALYAIALQSIAYALAKSPLFAFTGSTARGLDSLRGLMRSSPLSAVTSSILLYSLLGVPPLLGFWGKLYLFLASAGYSVWLVLAALINSGVSSVYYIIASRELLSKEGPAPSVPRSYRASLLIGAVALICLGVIAPLLLSGLVTIYL